MEGKPLRVPLATRKRRAGRWCRPRSAAGAGSGAGAASRTARSATRSTSSPATRSRAARTRARSSARQAGYGEHMVELSPGLDVRSSDAARPHRLHRPRLRRLTGRRRHGPTAARSSPRRRRTGCSSAGMRLARRPGRWSVKLQKADPGAPAPHAADLVAGLPLSLRRLRVEARPDRARHGLQAEGGVADDARRRDAVPSPTVAGGTVWIGLPVKDLSGVAEALLGVDARHRAA